MNTNTLETLLLETLTEMKAGAEKAGNFVVEQAPDVIQQLLAYEFWSATLCAVLLLTLAAVLAYVIVRIVRRYDDGTEAAALIPGFFCIMCLVGAMPLANKALKIKIAPKVYVIEYAAKVLKGR